MAEQIKDVVREKYAKAALRVVETSGSCCGSTSETDVVTRNLYDTCETASLILRQSSARSSPCPFRGRAWGSNGTPVPSTARRTAPTVISSGAFVRW